MINNNIGNKITTAYGVTQGRNSSLDIYSFYVSDMPNCTDQLPNIDYMDPHNIAQLADDTIVLASDLHSLKNKVNCLLTFSDEHYQSPNIEKTFYCHFTQFPSFESIQINEEMSIKCKKENWTQVFRYKTYSD